jgi:hypothetical protein
MCFVSRCLTSSSYLLTNHGGPAKCHEYREETLSDDLNADPGLFSLAGAVTWPMLLGNEYSHSPSTMRNCWSRQLGAASQQDARALHELFFIRKPRTLKLINVDHRMHAGDTLARDTDALLRAVCHCSMDHCKQSDDCTYAWIMRGSWQPA